MIFKNSTTTTKTPTGKQNVELCTINQFDFALDNSAFAGRCVLQSEKNMKLAKIDHTQVFLAYSIFLYICRLQGSVKAKQTRCSLHGFYPLAPKSFLSLLIISEKNHSANNVGWYNTIRLASYMYLDIFVSVNQ